MPKYRQLHVKIIDSFDFNEMPDDFTRVVWTLLILIVDSEGRGIYNMAWVKSKMFPLRQDVTTERLQNAFTWLNGRKMISVYCVSDRDYFYITNFKKYQSGTLKEAVSLLPSPNGFHSRPTPELLQSLSGVAEEEVRVVASASASDIESDLVVESESNTKQFIPVSLPPSIIKIFCEVTGMMGIPGGEIDKVLSAMEILTTHMNPEECTAYLKPYYESWIRKRGKNGKPYSKANCAWLYDQAISGMDDGQQPKNETTAQGGFYA